MTTNFVPCIVKIYKKIIETFMLKDTQLVIRELKKIGLSEKEARLYLALLRKGPSSAQKLAIALDITRPTSYRLLEDLVDRGLVRRVNVPQKAVKRFAAKAPDELLSLLRLKKRRVEEQERELLRMITELRAAYHQDDGGIVTYINKEETRNLIIDDIMGVSILHADRQEAEGGQRWVVCITP